MRFIISSVILLISHSIYAENILQLDMETSRSQVAIIIDDIGYNKQRGLAALNLPGALTYAVIPSSPNGEYLAKAAQRQEKEIILHAPMSNIHDYPLGELGLVDGMTEQAFNEALQQALGSVPHISGVNNHMGSLLTQKAVPMEWMMQALRDRGLYFIDSRTTSQSVAWEIAQRHGVPSLKRDIFLDNDRDKAVLEQQFSTLLKVAKRKGFAIGIGHPYPETITYLEENLKRLEQHGIQLVPASLLVDRFSPNLQKMQAKM